MKIIQHPLKFWDERPQNIEAIVLHCSAYEPKKMINVLQTKKLSTHYIIGTDGQVWQLIPEEKRAWHAGVSKWRGIENLNHRSIGIELSSPTMGQTAYPKKQMQSLLNICQDICHRHRQIIPQNIVAHSDVAPTRKPDPGTAMPWAWLADNGIGLWYDLTDAALMPSINIAKMLEIIGYDTENLAAASYAFCRHFAPHFIPYEADIRQLIDNVYPHEFILPTEAISILRATAWRYQNAT